MKNSILLSGITVTAWLAFSTLALAAPPVNAPGSNTNSTTGSPNSPNNPNNPAKPQSQVNHAVGKPKAGTLSVNRRNPSLPNAGGNANLLNQQMQMSQDRKAKAEQALSKLMKKSKESDSAAVSNPK